MNISRWIVRFVLAAITYSILSPLAMAQPAPPPSPEMAQACRGPIAGNRASVIRAAWPTAAPNLAALNSGAFDLAALNSDQVRLTFLGHATFLIESPQLVRIATDYNDYISLPLLPDIVTMNHAHDTHYSDHPDPAIKYVLRGWGMSPEQPAIWDLKYRDVRVRNVPTNIRSFYGSHDRALRQFDLYFRDCQPVHRTSRTSASYADATAAQRDRPCRRGHGAGRRHLYA